jgi:hypothetical protein
MAILNSLGMGINSGSALNEVNHSVVFDGANDEIDFTSSSFQTALNEANAYFKRSGSVSIWIKMPSSISANGQLYDFCIDEDNRITCQYKHAGNGFTCQFKGGGVGKLSSYTPSPSIEGDSTWHHVAHTWDKGTDNEQKLYIDGVLRNTTSLASTEMDGDFDDEATTDGVEIISGTSFNGNADYKGHMDDFAVYSDVLALSNVVALYNSGVSNPNDVPSQGTLVAHWKFNEGDGITTTDSVAGYVGTFGGVGKAPLWDTDNAAGE